MKLQSLLGRWVLCGKTETSFPSANMRVERHWVAHNGLLSSFGYTMRSSTTDSLLQNWIFIFWMQRLRNAPERLDVHDHFWSVRGTDHILVSLAYASTTERDAVLMYLHAAFWLEARWMRTMKQGLSIFSGSRFCSLQWGNLHEKHVQCMHSAHREHSSLSMMVFTESGHVFNSFSDFAVRCSVTHMSRGKL